MFKVNNKNSRKTSITSSWCLIVDFELYFTPYSSVSIVDFEQVYVKASQAKA